MTLNLSELRDEPLDDSPSAFRDAICVRRLGAAPLTSVWATRRWTPAPRINQLPWRLSAICRAGAPDLAASRRNPI